MHARRRALGRALASAAALATLIGAMAAALAVANVPDPREFVACLRTYPWLPACPEAAR